MTEIAENCKVKMSELTPNEVKTKMQYCNVPQGEEWRIPLLCNLLRIKSNELSLLNFDNKEIDHITNVVHLWYQCTTKVILYQKSNATRIIDKV